jgi:hypothetical protein
LGLKELRKFKPLETGVTMLGLLREGLMVVFTLVSVER